jgi:hypothetical protein
MTDHFPKGKSLSAKRTPASSSKWKKDIVDEIDEDDGSGMTIMVPTMTPMMMLALAIRPYTPLNSLLLEPAMPLSNLHLLPTDTRTTLTDIFRHHHHISSNPQDRDTPLFTLPMARCIPIPFHPLINSIFLIRIHHPAPKKSPSRNH